VNIRNKNYQNLIIGFQVTVENVGDVFLRHCVYGTQLSHPSVVRCNEHRRKVERKEAHRAMH